jgi:rubrerythrin
MKHTRRWWFNGLTTLSVLLCIGTKYLHTRQLAAHDADIQQIRSRNKDDLRELQRLGKEIDDRLATNFGNQSEYFLMDVPEHMSIREQEATRDSVSALQSQENRLVKEMQINYNVLQTGQRRDGQSIYFNLAIAAFSVLPATWLLTFICRKIQKSSRGQHGICLQCGYDLRATPNYCPECGAMTLKNSLKD